MREIQHMHSIYWKTTRDDVEKQREIEYALAKMEHRIHLIKEATKAKAEQMVMKEIPRRKITAIAVAPNTTDDMFEYYIHSLQKYEANG